MATWFCREQFTLPVFLSLWLSELEDIVFRSRDPLLGVRKQRWASEHCSHYSDYLIFSIWQTSTRLSSLSLRIYFSLKTFHELVDCFCNISSFNTKYLSMPIHSWSTKHMLGLVLIAGQTAVNEILYKALKGSVFSYRWWLLFSHLSHGWLFAIPWTTACQASLPFTISQSLLKLMSIELMMLSNNLNLCCPFFLLLSIFANIRVFSSELAFRIRWPKYQHFRFSISLYNEYSVLISFRTDWFDLLAIQWTLKNLLQHHNSKASIL